MLRVGARGGGPLLLTGAAPHQADDIEYVRGIDDPRVVAIAVVVALVAAVSPTG